MKYSHLIVFIVVFLCSVPLRADAQTTDVRSTMASLDASVQELKFQLEAIKSSIDANTHLIKSQSDAFNLKSSEMDARIGSLEEKLKIQGKQVTTAVSTVAPEAAEEAGLYQEALNQINQSEFLKAIATFKKFQKKFPKSEYVSGAQYWIGECYFAMRDFEQAIKEFQLLREKYPHSEKVPSALLKQGYSFVELEMDSDANLFFNDLIRRHPRTKEAKEAKDYMKREKDLRTSDKSKSPGEGVPLAPGVVVPDKKSKDNVGKYDY